MAEMIVDWGKASWALWVDLAPYLVLGFFLAGLLHEVFGEATVRRHFSSNRFSSVLKATLLGIPLPVCSCGVIPLAESLRKDGASKGATLAFLVSTPTSGVDSILATYGMMGPFFAVMRPLAGLLSGLGIGAAARVLDKEEKPAEKRVVATAPGRRGRFGVRALRDMMEYGFGQLPRDTGKWVLIGTLAGGLLTALIPAGFIESHLDSQFLQYLVALFMSVPLYVCATGSIPLVLALMSSGVMPGAAMIFLIAGPATNTVTVTFLLRRMGWKITTLYLAMISLVAVALGLFTDWFFSRSAVGDALHLHHHSAGQSWWEIALAVVLLALVLWQIYFLRWFRGTTGGERQGETTVLVPDMSCRVCQRKIHDRLTSLPGLNDLTVDLDRKEVCFPDGRQRQLVLEELQRLGYHPKEEALSE